MKQILYSLLLTLTFTTNVLPLTESATLLAHKETGKRVLLLGDAHDQNLITHLNNQPEKNRTAAQAAISHLHTVKNKQRKELTTFAHALIAGKNKQDGQTVVISEIGNYELTTLFKQNASTIRETIDVLPCIIINHLGKSAKQDELDMQKFISPFDGGQENIFQVTGKLHFVAGDYYRSSALDTLLLWINQHLRNNKDLSSLNKELPTHVTQITIGTLKEDLLESRPFLEKYGIKTNNEQLLADINTVPESTLILDAAIQLQQNNPTKVRALSDALFQFQANKCDAELSSYVTAIENSNQIKQIVIGAGASHTNVIKERLLKNGFQVIEECDQSCFKFNKASFDEFTTIVEQSLNTLHQKSPHALLPKFCQA